MKINMLNRYSFDWSSYELDGLKVNQRRNTGLEQVPTETLRNIWMARFGERAVLAKDVYELRGEDIADVVQELAERKLVRSEQNYRADELEVKNYYVLERENADH